MPALTTAAPLTLEEFRERYTGEPFEYWHGEAVKKGTPTWFHALLQAILAEMLTRAGYVAGSELDLRIDPDFEPRPDGAAGRQRARKRYPTSPDEVEIVVEVLSPDDRFVKVHEKCAEYTRLGIAQVFVADPEGEKAWQWDPALGQLTRTGYWTLTNGRTICLPDAWRELRKRAHLDDRE
jgi:Uma2 family endonuclease